MSTSSRLVPCALCLATACCAPAAFAQAPTTHVAQPAWGSTPAPQRAVAPREATALDAPPEPVTLATRPAAQHALYLEGNTLGAMMESLGVTYAFRPLRGLAVSAGIGGSYLTLINTSALYGGQVMVHGLFGGAGAGSFEVAGGAAVVVADGAASLLTQQHSANGDVSVTPSAFAGYRYQPLGGGLLFRVGAGWSYGNGVGASVSVGGAF